MENIAADFTISNENTINAEYSIEQDNFDCSFEIFASGVVWGAITGNITDQTDLINILNEKATISYVDTNIHTLSGNLTSEINARTLADSGLQTQIDNINNAGYITKDVNNLSYYMLSTDINTALNSKQNTISDLADIRNNAENGNIAYNTIQNYGDIVTYNATYFATASQGALADTSIQPNDDITLLNNNAGYITNSALNGYATETYVNSQGFITIDALNGYATESFVTSRGYITGIDNADVVNALGYTPYDSSNPAGYITSASLPTVNNSTITIQKNGTTVESFTLNQANNETINITVPTSAADVNALPDSTTINDLTTTAQQNALNSGATTTNISQIATNTQAISTETLNRQNADNNLQTQIDAIVSSSDVFDIVGTYAELQAYDIATVPVNDIVKVLVDSTHNDAATYYRCVENGGVKSWTYIGSEGAYYTKGEADSKFALQTTTVNSHALSSNITLTASDVGALPDSTVIPTVNNSSITFQKNGADFDTITLNQSSNDTINFTVPTDTNDLTNGAGYITAASLPTDYYTKSEIDAIIPQPTKVPIVYYQPTDSYCYTENNNRFFGSHVFEKLYLAQPKTSGTTQVIDMSTTFSLSFTIDYQKAPSSAVTVAEIIASYSAGKGVLLQLNSTGLYYRNNITGTTITGTRALTAGNSYDVKAEYDGTHLIISYKLSSDANYTQINSTTCTCDGSNYNYAAIGMNADNGNMSLSSVVLTNGADTLYSYTAGKIALDYDGSTLKLNASNQLSVDFTGYATEAWVGNQGYLTSSDLTNYVTTNTAQTISAKKTFTGEKAILFKQTSNSDKLGFTLYNSSNTELGALEYRPNTISGASLLALNCPQATGGYVGFRYWGTPAVNIVAPKVATAGNYYIPTHITNGSTTVTASNTGSVNISSLLPDVSNFVTDTSLATTLADYVTNSALLATLEHYQPVLISGVNIKTINNTDILGSGNIDVADTDLSNLSTTGQAIIDGKADTDLSNLSATGQGIIDAKVNNDDYYYKSGDTVTNLVVFTGGLLTNSGQEISFCIWLPKSLKNITTITCTALSTGFRKTAGGYMPSSGGNGWNAKTKGTVTIHRQSDNMIRVQVNYSNYGGTNNTPVGVWAQISLSFT